MIRKIRFLMSSALFPLVLCAQAAAFMASDRIEMTVDIAVQTAKGAPRMYCRDSLAVDGHHKREWWMSFQPSSLPSAVNGPPGGSEVICGTGGADQAAGGPETFGKPPVLTAELVTRARIVRRVEDEKNLEVEVSVSLRRLTGHDLQGKPVFRDSILNRNFLFSGSGDAIVPLQITSPNESGNVPDHEIYLRVTVSATAAREASALGTILLGSELGDSAIYLDGGLAGHLTAGEETPLRNVQAGMRLLEVRDAAGRRLRRAVRVVPGRTVLARFNDPDSRGQTNGLRLEPLGPNERGFEEFRRQDDGAVVVRVPAGEFLMGNRETERTPLEHTVYVSDFFMDKTGVSWGQYKTFAAATGTPLPPHPPYWGYIDDHPAVYVTWSEANNFCEWAWGRLPTEAEREKAARGSDGRKFPWGDTEPEPGLAQFRKSWGYDATAAVGAHPAGASPYGLLDMGGNVWEWCSDWYADDYYEMSPYRDPQGPGSGMTHVVRGGSWDSRPSVLSASCRSWGHPGYRDGDFGFRCAMNAPVRAGHAGD